ncbi:MAG: sigma-70 family RNA polymerase sigma factor [Bacteroidales bacterium]|nr:sigma-70 family RNA polymerase sigma factor [Bacteroidales bacterium]
MYKELDEQELARYCVKGDRLAEDELYRRYAARVLTLCRRYADNTDDAKDLMQDAIIRALDKISTFTYSGKGSLYAWISRIAINMALNQIKRQRWKTVSLDVWQRDNIPEPGEDVMAAIPQELLLEWISKLPDVRKAVFNLYCIDGYSHKQIGEMLGISEKGSAGVLAKARKQLKESIRSYLKEKER